jgi:hypothetical protein
MTGRPPPRPLFHNPSFRELRPALLDYASQLVALSRLRLMLSAQYRFAAPTGNAHVNCKYP